MVRRLVARSAVVAGAAAAAMPRRRRLPGRLNQVRYARCLVPGVPDGCPRAYAAVLLADELVVDALVRTRPGCDGVVRGHRAWWPSRGQRPSCRCSCLLSAAGGERVAAAARGYAVAAIAGQAAGCCAHVLRAALPARPNGGQGMLTVTGEVID